MDRNNYSSNIDESRKIIREALLPALKIIGNPPKGKGSKIRINASKFIIEQNGLPIPKVGFLNSVDEILEYLNILKKKKIF